MSAPSVRRQVEDFLGSNGLRLGEVDLYLAVLSEEGSILAGGGLQRDIVKCLAVSESARSLGLSVPLVSRLISVAADRGHTNVKVFTKPENRSLFESLGFRLLAEAPKAILMENGRGLEDYCAYLRGHRADGVVVMNANPFTLGHRYLVEQASALGPSTGSGTERVSDGEPVEPPKHQSVVVIPVMEDASRFPYAERLEMIRRGCEGLADVVEGSDYQISAATFPTYFLKDLSDAAETQMRLDIDLFGRHIAPALGASVRFVGGEPADPLTARYNALMQKLLPAYGVRVVEIQRLALGPSTSTGTERVSDGEFVEPQKQEPVTATRVREALDAGRFPQALTPASTWPYLLAELADRALRMELDTPLKPGLVGPDSAGAHADMDYALMRRGIAAIRPFFPCMAQAATAEELRRLGIDAEQAMMAATGGVNTHRGAIFALGLALDAAGRHFAQTERLMEVGENERDMQKCLLQIARSILHNQLKDSELHSTVKSHGNEAVRQYGAKGAREMALDGYKDLFACWLPYYRSVKADAYGLQKTLLKIMSELDDTCVIHRVGYEGAQEVKAEAGEIAGQAGNDGGSTGSPTVMPDLVGHLKDMCDRYARERISPGGAADMLALTIFMDSILH